SQFTHKDCTLSLHDALPIFVTGTTATVDKSGNVSYSSGSIKRAIGNLLTGGWTTTLSNSNFSELYKAPVGKGVMKIPGYGKYFEDRKSTRLNSSHVKISYAV